MANHLLPHAPPPPQYLLIFSGGRPLAISRVSDSVPRSNPANASSRIVQNVRAAGTSLTKIQSTRLWARFELGLSLLLVTNKQLLNCNQSIRMWVNQRSRSFSQRKWWWVAMGGALVLFGVAVAAHCITRQPRWIERPPIAKPKRALHMVLRFACGSAGVPCMSSLGPVVQTPPSTTVERVREGEL
eukprot:SAG25_NODE_224_length_11578_cov_10.606325_5_plen_186_part_00